MRRPSGRIGMVVVAICAAVLVAGCGGDEPPPEDVVRPSDVVRDALGKQLVGDIEGATELLCPDAVPLGAMDLPVPIDRLFGPTVGFDFGTAAATLQLYDFDAGGLLISDLGGTAPAGVGISGILVERVDPARIEDAIRVAAAQVGARIDWTALERSFARFSGSQTRLRVDEIVHVERIDGDWRICGPFAG